MKGHEDSNPDVAFEALVRAQLTRMGYDASAVPDEVAGAAKPSCLPQAPTSNTASPRSDATRLLARVPRCAARASASERRPATASRLCRRLPRLRTGRRGSFGPAPGAPPRRRRTRVASPRRALLPACGNDDPNPRLPFPSRGPRWRCVVCDPGVQRAGPGAAAHPPRQRAGGGVSASPSPPRVCRRRVGGLERRGRLLCVAHTQGRPDASPPAAGRGRKLPPPRRGLERAPLSGPKRGRPTHAPQPAAATTARCPVAVAASERQGAAAVRRADEQEARRRRLRRPRAASRLGARRRWPPPCPPPDAKPLCAADREAARRAALAGACGHGLRLLTRRRRAWVPRFTGPQYRSMLHDADSEPAAAAWTRREGVGRLASRPTVRGWVSLSLERWLNEVPPQAFPLFLDSPRKEVRRKKTSSRWRGAHFNDKI